jgi:hypothetical protein
MEVPLCMIFRLATISHLNMIVTIVVFIWQMNIVYIIG